MKISLAFQRKSIHSACDAVPAALLSRESSTTVVMIYMMIYMIYSEEDRL